MIVDTSALIAILRDEPEASFCAHTIENSAVRRVSAANFVEAAVIIDASPDPVASRRFDDLIKEAQIIIEPVTEPQLELLGCLSRLRQRQQPLSQAIALPVRLQSSQGAVAAQRRRFRAFRQ